ncbi:hypothetical protein M3Y94_00421500 [Aphelenchoides besseyi]|nr:hypothetical protein M3Y94_00421500 [Aphelenchoides besseyi]
MSTWTLKLAVLVVCLATSVRWSDGCASLGSQKHYGSTDSQIFTDPTLSWSMSPPAAWTYPATWAQTTAQVFPSQPLFQTDAENQADGDLRAATLESLAANNLPTNGVRVTANYQPQMISDCVKVAGTGTGIPTTTTSGTVFGIYESGAITQLATTTADLTPANCIARNFATGVTFQQNVVQASLSVSTGNQREGLINGLTLNGLQLRQLAAQLQNLLNFNYRVRFTTEITFT